jgi:hypothetical protein
VTKTSARALAATLTVELLVRSRMAGSMLLKPYNRRASRKQTTYSPCGYWPLSQRTLISLYHPPLSAEQLQPHCCIRNHVCFGKTNIIVAHLRRYREYHDPAAVLDFEDTRRLSLQGTSSVWRRCTGGVLGWSGCINISNCFCFWSQERNIPEPRQELSIRKDDQSDSKSFFRF